MLFREIDDVVPIICGYCAWAGGDSAKVEENDLAYNLGIDSTLVASTIQFLSVKGFLEPRSREFGLTTKGSRLVDYSLLRIIGKWSFFSELEGGYYRTMQNIFTTSKLSLQRNLAGIRSSYILEFGQLVMNRLSSSIEGYSMDQYPDLRRMVIRMSLNPSLDFVLPRVRGSDDSNDDMMSLLLKKDILRIWRIPEIVLLLDPKILRTREVIGGTQRRIEEETK